MEVEGLLLSLLFHHTDSWLPRFLPCWPWLLQRCLPYGKAKALLWSVCVPVPDCSFGPECPDFSSAQTCRYFLQLRPLSLLCFLDFLVLTHVFLGRGWLSWWDAVWLPSFCPGSFPLQGLWYTVSAFAVMRATGSELRTMAVESDWPGFEFGELLNLLVPWFLNCKMRMIVSISWYCCKD